LGKEVNDEEFEAAGILSVVMTSLGLTAAYVYGLGLIIWFVWLGIVILCSNPGNTV
jgi:hypothetical protein